MEEQSGIRRRHEILQPLLDERSRRLVLAAEAAALGRGGIAVVARATGASRPMIARGISEIQSPGQPLPKGRPRGSGARRNRPAETRPPRRRGLESLIDPMSRGEPDSALRWTIKSVRRLSDELVK